MKLLTFKGGIHPDDGKVHSKDCPIVDVTPGEELVYPLSQHIGGPAIPIVKKGDYVRKGQMIAEAGGFVSAPVYSSVSGNVKSIETRFGPTGNKMECIIVTNDGQYEEEQKDDWKPYEEMSREDIIERIGQAGIVGMGGAGFPTRIKLSPKEPDKIEYIIANCAECEPYITADYRRMLEHTEELIQGMKIILSLFPNATGIFAVENNKKDCVDQLLKATEKEERMEVKMLAAKYPQGAERQLIYAVTKRAIHSGMLPADAGCIVDNVETIISIYNAVVQKKPLTYRVITVSGDAVNSPGNFRVPLGVSHRELVEAAGGFAATPEKIISGGPMMGFAMITIDAPVTKTTSSLLAFKEDIVSRSLETACINCGRCVDACPSRILPSRLAEFARRYDEASFLAFHGLECVECGSCSYVCPAKRHLKQAIGSMRKTALANKRKK